MIICLCHRLSDRDIQRAAQRGVQTFEELQDETCIARNCACCEEIAREVFDDARAAAGCGGACACREALEV
jgi:bacterioferritin-associated ferredoxin